MRYPTQTFLPTLLLAALIAAIPTWANAHTSPGETSGAQLSPLRVTDYDRATGEMRLSYQSGCGASDNTIYYGSLDQVSSLAFSGEVCDIGMQGSHTGFNPGAGSYFFLIVGNEGREEGSYGRSRFAGTDVERPPRTANACGVVQSLADTCTPTSAGAACASSAECGVRQGCVQNATGGAGCACLEPFNGAFCETCAPGYTGPDCRACAPGFVSNKIQNSNGGEDPVDLTAPDVFRCEPDVPGDCAGRTCGGHGTCVVSDRDAICACNPGFTGSDCQDCSPNYERNATGACVLGASCRDAKCGTHGNCVSAAFGEVSCQCDAGYAGVDCGGSPLTIGASSDTLTLYEGQSILLQPQGGVGPYSWTLVGGPGRLDPCDPRGTDPLCPPNAARMTATARDPIMDGVVILNTHLADGAGHQTAINLASIPSSLLPFTGSIHNELVPFYNAMLKYMRARGVRGAVLGISKGGSVIATNGYGYRDAGLDNDPFVNAGEPGPLVQPDSPFRIASVTKPLTAAAVRGAAADLGVNIASAFGVNGAANWVQHSIGFDLVAGSPPFNYNVQPAGTTDPRWASVSIQHLLNHHVGFLRDSNAVLPAVPGQPKYNAGVLPFTSDPNNQSGLQTAYSGTSSDISYATSYVFAAQKLYDDPRPTVRQMILFAAGNKFQYPPGGNDGGGDNYANIGYQLAGRVLEGLKGQTYNPNDPTVPDGWGKFPKLLQNYLCESSGIHTGIYPGDAFNPQPTEPYYREFSSSFLESRAWDIAHGSDRIRFNDQAQMWEFCSGNCPDGPGQFWSSAINAPKAYGGVWLAQRNSAGGIVATTNALLRFARNHRVKVGTQGDGAKGIGSLLDAPGQYGASSSHNGLLPGTRSWLWQMGGWRNNKLPLDWRAWNSDPSAPLDLDEDGKVLVDEATLIHGCPLPQDVAVAVMLNQTQDRRAPAGGAAGGSSNNAVYGRIIDMLGNAACTVNAQGWPQFAEPPAQLGVEPPCN